MEGKKIEKFQPKQEVGLEKEKFQPKIIFDFIRHGQAEYGQELADKMAKLGFNFEKELPNSQIAKEQLNTTETWEGRITPEGEKQLRRSIAELVDEINLDNEVIMVLSGTRSRHKLSYDIVLNELEKHSVDIFKARTHEDIVDTKKHWISILEFVKNKITKGQNPWDYWLKMTKKEIEEGDIESIEDIQNRTDHFIKLLTKYRNIYKNKLDLDNKILRVISITSDVNISLLFKNENLDMEKVSKIKNAQIIELGVDETGKKKFMT